MDVRGTVGSQQPVARASGWRCSEASAWNKCHEQDHYANRLFVNSQGKPLYLNKGLGREKSLPLIYSCHIKWTFSWIKRLCCHPPPLQPLCVVCVFYMTIVTLKFYTLVLPLLTKHAKVLKLYRAVHVTSMHANSWPCTPMPTRDASDAETPLAQDKRWVSSCIVSPCPDKSELCCSLLPSSTITPVFEIFLPAIAIHPTLKQPAKIK